MPENPIEVKLEELRQRVAKCNRIITELEPNGGFKDLLSDFEATKKRIDDNWHLVSDPKQLEEMRVTKLAVSSILTSLENYRHDMKLAQEEIAKIENPDLIIHRDWDKE